MKPPLGKTLPGARAATGHRLLANCTVTASDHNHIVTATTFRAEIEHDGVREAPHFGPFRRADQLQAGDFSNLARLGQLPHFCNHQRDMRAETTLNLGCGQQMLGFPPSQSARGSAGAHPVEIGFSLAGASAAFRWLRRGKQTV